MAALKFVLALTLCAAGQNLAQATAAVCSLDVQVVYPQTVGGKPEPVCSASCSNDAGEMWYDGVAYKKFTELKEQFNQMVAVEFQNGVLTSCKTVTYVSDEQLRVNAGVLKECLGAEQALVVPTTDGPTTAAPTTEGTITEAPTTEVPITEAPTTAAATTEVPTTAAPTTEVPTTAAPTTEVPISEVPTTAAPTTAAPTTAAPTTAAPTTEAPTTAAPTTEAPTTAAPTTAAPTTTVAPTTTAARTTAATTTPAPSCATGFTLLGGSCYLVGTTEVTKAAGDTYCNSLGAYLATIENQLEQDTLAGFLTTSVYIGLNDIAVEGTFVYPGRSGITYTNWNTGEPSNTSNEDCVVMKDNLAYRWNDVKCTKIFPALCKRAPSN